MFNTKNNKPATKSEILAVIDAYDGMLKQYGWEERLPRHLVEARMRWVCELQKLGGR
jgi:hypothetical protein